MHRFSIFFPAVFILVTGVSAGYTQTPDIVRLFLPPDKPVQAVEGTSQTLSVSPDGTIVWKTIKGDFVRFSIPVPVKEDPLSYDLVKFDVKLEGGISEVMTYVDFPGRESWIYRPIDITEYGDKWMTVFLDLHLAEFILKVSHPVKAGQVTFQFRAIDGERPDQKPYRCVSIKNIRLVKTPIKADWNEADYSFSDAEGLVYSYPVRVKNTSSKTQTVISRIEEIEKVWAEAVITPHDAVIAPHDSALFAVKISLPREKAESVPLLYCESFQPFFSVKGKPETEVSILRSTDLTRLVVIKPPKKMLPVVYTTREKLERARRWAETTDWGKKQKEEIVNAAEAILKKDQAIPDIGGFANAYYYCTEHRCRLVYEGPGKHKCPIGGEYRTKNFMGVDLDLDYTNIVHVALIKSTFPLAKAFALTGDKRYSERARFLYFGYMEKYFTYKPMDLDAQTQTIDRGRTVFAKYMESFNFGDFFMAYDLLKGCGAFTEAETKKLEHDFLIPCAVEMANYRMEMSHREENISRCAFFMGLTTGHPTLLAFGSSSPYSLQALNRYAAGADGHPMENDQSYHFAFANTVDEFAQAFENIGIPAFDFSLKRHAMGIYRYVTSFSGQNIPNQGTLYGLHYQDPFFRDHCGDDLFLGKVNHLKDESGPYKFPDESVNFPFSGDTVLKRPNPDGGSFIAQMNWAGPKQRGDFEVLSPKFYAYGSLITDECGHFDWGSTDWHHSWQIMSASHSTLVVDKHNQSGLKELDYTKGSYGPHPSTQLYYNDQGDVPATVVHNDRIYPGVKIWRALAVIDGAFILMDRLESNKPHTYDWFFYGVPDKSDGLSGIHLDMLKREAPLGETDGYEIPSNLSEAKTSGVIKTDWTYNPKDKAKTFGLSLTMLNSEPVSAIHGFTLAAPYRSKEKEFVLIRKENAQNTNYLAVFEAHKGQAKIKSILPVSLEEQGSDGSWKKSERSNALLITLSDGKSCEVVLNPTGSTVRTANQTVYEAWGSTIISK
jgi:hypothetical protein